MTHRRRTKRLPLFSQSRSFEQEHQKQKSVHTILKKDSFIPIVTTVFLQTFLTEKTYNQMTLALVQDPFDKSLNHFEKQLQQSYNSIAEPSSEATARTVYASDACSTPKKQSSQPQEQQQQHAHSQGERHNQNEPTQSSPSTLVMRTVVGTLGTYSVTMGVDNGDGERMNATYSPGTETEQEINDYERDEETEEDFVGNSRFNERLFTFSFPQPNGKKIVKYEMVDDDMDREFDQQIEHCLLASSTMTNHDLRRSSSCIDYKSHTKELRKLRDRALGGTVDERQAARLPDRQEARAMEVNEEEDLEDSNLKRLNTHHYVTSPYDRGGNRLRQISGKLRDKLSFAKRDRKPTCPSFTPPQQQEPYEDQEGKTTINCTLPNPSKKRQISFLGLKKKRAFTAQPQPQQPQQPQPQQPQQQQQPQQPQQQRVHSNEGNGYLGGGRARKKSKRERSFLYLRRKLGYLSEHRNELSSDRKAEDKHEEEEGEEDTVISNEVVAMCTENERLLKEVSEAEMNAFEKQTLQNRVCALEHALDTVRGEASEIRDHALEVLMQSDPDNHH